MRGGLASSFVLVALALGLSGCTGSEAAPAHADPGPIVRTVVAAASEGGDARAFTGSIHARYESDLSFRVGGQITARLVNDGEHVRQGQALFRLDASDYQLAARAAGADVVAAEARHRFAEAERARLAALLDGGAVSRSDVERATAEAEASAEVLRSARAAAQVASNQNRYATLMADADGVITMLRADAGQVVTAGQPIVRVARDGPREVEVALPEEFGRLAVGQTAQVHFLGANDGAASAHLRELSGAADAVTRTFSARFALDEGAAAPLGSTASVRIPSTDADGDAGISVPLSALNDRGQGPGLWVIDPRSNRVSWRPVRVASYGDDEVRIAQGLAPGEIVVTLGVHLLTQGQVVRREQGAPLAAAGADLRARAP